MLFINFLIKKINLGGIILILVFLVEIFNNYYIRISHNVYHH